MKKIFTILVLTSITINLNSQSLIRKFFGGAASALGELFIENVFYDGSDEIIESKLQQLILSRNQSL